MGKLIAKGKHTVKGGNHPHTNMTSKPAIMGSSCCGLMIWIVSVAVPVRSLIQHSGWRIQHCHSCDVGCSCSSDLVPGLRASTLCGCSRKTNKQTKKNSNHEKRRVQMQGIGNTIEIKRPATQKNCTYNQSINIEVYISTHTHTHTHTLLYQNFMGTKNQKKYIRYTHKKEKATQIQLQRSNHKRRDQKRKRRKKTYKNKC